MLQCILHLLFIILHVSILHLRNISNNNNNSSSITVMVVRTISLLITNNRLGHNCRYRSCCRPALGARVA